MARKQLGVAPTNALEASRKSDTDNKIGSGNSTITGVEWYANEAALPAVGVAGVLYLVDAV